MRSNDRSIVQSVEVQSLNVVEFVAFGNVDDFIFDANSTQPDDNDANSASDTNGRNDNVETAEKATVDGHCLPSGSTPTIAHLDEINGEYIEPHNVDVEECNEIREIATMNHTTNDDILSMSDGTLTNRSHAYVASKS